MIVTFQKQSPTSAQNHRDRRSGYYIKMNERKTAFLHFSGLIEKFGHHSELAVSVV